MYIYYSDLNSAWTKNFYLVPNICKLVDNSYRFKLLPFMDSYLSPNQIPLDPLDRNKIALMVDKGNFCYKVMPSGLKIVEETY